MTAETEAGETAAMWMMKVGDKGIAFQGERADGLSGRSRVKRFPQW
jgi:hypothetical protein